MQSSKRVFSSTRATNFMRLVIGADLKEFVVLDESSKTTIASLDSPKHAERLAAMLSDTPITNADFHDQMSDADNKRLCETMKLFCLQENLTWADLGFTEDEIRTVNKFLEMPLDLWQQTSE